MFFKSYLRNNFLERMDGKLQEHFKSRGFEENVYIRFILFNSVLSRYFLTEHFVQGDIPGGIRH